MSLEEMKSVCQIRTLTGLPCERCTYADKCKTHLKEKEGISNEQKKKRRSRRKEDSSK